MNVVPGTKVLARQMKANGLTQATLARALGVQRCTVFRWLAGSVPEDDMQILLERMLGIERVEWLTVDQRKRVSKLTREAMFELAGRAA